jgi:DNA-binding beta-propeller fold protein YncE
MGKRVRTSTSLFTAIFLSAMATTAMAGDLKVTYLHNLANFDGALPYMWANISLDPDHNEVYVVDTSQSDMRIFNDNGMEVYQFGSDGSLGAAIDIAVGSSGNLCVLSLKQGKPTLTWCNFRGEALSEIDIRNLPPDFSGFSPERITFHHDNLYLADSAGMKIIVTDSTGEFKKGFLLSSLLKLKGKAAANTDLGGFNVDGDGTILFTTPTLFSAHLLSPDGKVTSFGTAGSGRGKFGIVSGIAGDAQGNIYVTDKLRCVVMVFDRNLEFRTEFGYRGYGPANLIVPNGLAVDATGKVYVSQAANRGVSVFQVSYN